MIRIAKPKFSNEAFLNIKKVLKSGNLVQGKNVEKFEHKIKSLIKTKYCVVVSSGTAALHLSLLSLGIKKDDEIIVPAFSYVATANVVELCQAKPIFVDINNDDFCINVDWIEKKITSKTKCIIAVHEFGMPCKIDKIINIAKKYNLKIIEDAACALGAKYNNRIIGSFGDLGCFSLHPRKNITTGEGGIIVTNNKNLYEFVKSMKNHGSGIIKNKKDYINAGFNYRLTDFQAILGLDQIKKIKDIIKYRNKLAFLYDFYLSKIDWIKTPIKYLNRYSVYQSYHILLDKRINTKNLILYLQKNKVESNIGAQAIHIQSYYKKKYLFQNKDFVNSYNAFKHGLVLPIGEHIKKNHIIKICNIIKKYKK